MDQAGVFGTAVKSTLYVAIELSRSSWVVALLAPGARRPSRHQLEAGDVEGLLTLIARHQAGAARVLSCYEAGYEGFWLHRRLQAAGIDSWIVDPSSLRVDRRARRRKTDAIDAETILRALTAWDRGERDQCSMVRVPDVAPEDARRDSRERERLIKEQTGHLNRIRGLLTAMGIYDFNPRKTDRLELLAGLMTGDGRPLPERLSLEIRREIERLSLVERQIAELERARRKPAPRGRPRKDAPPQPAPDLATSDGRIRHLQRLRGVGPDIASVLHNEVFYRSFANRREVAAYCGLDPTPFASGNLRREQGISKAGNRRARHAAIELAWLWLQWQPDSALARWFHDRIGPATGRLKRVMIVALARKLVIALWRFLHSGTMPEGAVLKA
ncbi:MAG: IS110 family transposase [Alphaproteobacteria bacterium]|nr:IS110 family transposase [Alphaproteobacteria bacterium]